VKHATGDFLTFADSDDLVVPGAYAAMVTVLGSSGSDFVVGSYDRLVKGRRTPVKLADRLHKEERTGLKLGELPEVIDDVFIWNKMFRKDFWDRHVGPMPEGVLYEDQETTAKAYLRARSFDLLSRCVYSWRVRDDASSITQGKRELHDLTDRLKVAHQVSGLFLRSGEQGALQAWVKRLLGSDLLPYYRQSANATDDYWAALSAGIRSLAALLLDHECLDVPASSLLGPHARILLEAALQGDREVVECVVVSWQENGTGYEIIPSDDGFLARPGYWSALPAHLRQISWDIVPEDMEFVSSVSLSERTSDGSVMLRGHA
jgi:hypothetical protein